MKLTVAILTYNQAPCIQKALDSVLMQEVNFEYEIVVADDFSTDSTRDILCKYARNYPGKFKIIFNENNIGISRNYQKVLNVCQGEYISLLEGDDYWTDKTKLQKSVDFLDSHLDYGFVGAYNTILCPNGNIIKDPYDHFSYCNRTIEGSWILFGDVFEYAKYGPVTRTLTVCFRKSIIQPYMQYVGIGNDMVLQCILAHDSKFAKNQEEWGIYRQGGVSTTHDNEKTLYYEKWYVENRLLQKQIYPLECNWDENELKDIITYTQLKFALKNIHIQDAMQYHGMIRSQLYKKKHYYRYSKNIIRCLIIGVMLKCGLIK